MEYHCNNNTHYDLSILDGVDLKNRFLSYWLLSINEYMLSYECSLVRYNDMILWYIYITYLWYLKIIISQARKDNYTNGDCSRPPTISPFGIYMNRNKRFLFFFTLYQSNSIFGDVIQSTNFISHSDQYTKEIFCDLAVISLKQIANKKFKTCNATIRKEK